MTEETKYFEIETGLTGNKAYEILRSVDCHLSDGIWENSSRMDGYWKFENIDMIGDKVVIKIDKNQFKSWQVSHYSARRGSYKETCSLTNKFYQMIKIDGLELGYQHIRNWFADKLKQIVKLELKDNSKGSWKRDNNSQLDYLGGDSEPVTIADAYYVYDILKGRKVK